MLRDQATGRTKKSTPGQCIYCDEPAQFVGLGIPFCRECKALMKDENKLATRIKWT